MRILHLLNHCDRANGNVHVAVDLACEQARRGHRAFVVSAGGHYEELLARHGVEHILLQQPKRDPVQVLRAILQLASLIRRTQADVVHAHMMTGAAIGFAACRLTGRKLVTHVHNSFDPHAILMRLGDRVIAVSSAVALQMETRGVAKRKIRTVLNAPLNTARHEKGLPDVELLQRPSITTVCGLHGRKGVPDLLAAFEKVAAEFEAAHLYVVGNGPARTEYETIAKSMACGSRIHFEGSSLDPRGYLQATDIFVLASHADPCPLVIPEAREAGCAIVATDVDGIPETLDGGRAGLLVPARNATALAGAINSLLANPSVLHEQRRRSYANIERFAVTNLCDDVTGIYREVLEPRRSRKRTSTPTPIGESASGPDA